jgi:transcriptional regulator with XRE-family HTH domain
MHPGEITRALDGGRTRPQTEGVATVEPARRTKISPAGWILREWRGTRGMSQLDLAHAARVSTRHLSFVETGRSEPSRELLMRLSAALDMPPRDRNALLAAAGYQPIYREAAWDTPASAELVHAVKLILRQHEPFGAVAFNREGDILMMNHGFARFATLLLGADRIPPPFTITPPPRLNVVALTFDPASGARPYLRNWRTVARAVLHRVRAETALKRDTRMRELFDQVMAYPDVASLLDDDDEPSAGFVIPLELDFMGQVVKLFTTITTLGTPQDVNASELRIEAYHPADAATEQLGRALAESS